MHKTKKSMLRFGFAVSHDANVKTNVTLTVLTWDVDHVDRWLHTDLHLSSFIARRKVWAGEQEICATVNLRAQTRYEQEKSKSELEQGQLGCEERVVWESVTKSEHEIVKLCYQMKNYALELRQEVNPILYICGTCIVGILVWTFCTYSNYGLQVHSGVYPARHILDHKASLCDWLLLFVKLTLDNKLHNTHSKAKKPSSNIMQQQQKTPQTIFTQHPSTILKLAQAHDCDLL